MKEKIAHKKSSIYKLTLFLLILTAFSAVSLSSPSVNADDSVVDQVRITVPVSCTLGGTGMNTHNAEILNGAYQADIGTTVLHAICNDNGGFAIYAAGYTGDEVGGTNSNKLVGTSVTNYATIVTGLATSTPTPDVSNWAMKLAITQDSGNTTGTNAFVIDSAPNVENGADASFSAYHVVPNEFTKVAHKNTGTDMTAVTGGVKLTTTYAVYVSRLQPADTYSGQVIYVLVHPSTAAAPAVICNPEAEDIEDAVCLQDFAGEHRDDIVDSMTAETHYTLKDSRDGKSYTIAKYAVGNNDYDVWMTQNLDLDLDSSRTYTNADTDLGYNTTTGEYEAASWTPLRSTYATTQSQTHQWCNGGTWSANSEYDHCTGNETPESYDPGDLYWDKNGSGASNYYNYTSSCVYTTNTPVCDQTLNPIAGLVTSSANSIPQYHLGNYYNWAAAVASNDSSVYGEDDVVEQSICPAGWTLPRGGMGDDTHYALWIAYGFNFPMNFSTGDYLYDGPLYVAPSGYFNDGVLVNIFTEGAYWESVASSGDEAFDQNFDSRWYDLDISYGVASGRSKGFSVRCVLRPVTATFSVDW